MSDFNIHIAELFLRVLTGILFLFQGYDKLFRIKIPGVVNAFQGQAAIYQIPKWVLYSLAYYTAFTEFIAGLLLIPGLFTDYALYALGLELLLVSLAFSVVEPMWNTKHLFPRFLMIILLLILPSENNPFSLDFFLANT